MTKARSNAVANAAKGDLTVGTGTNLSGILPVGANGEIFVADASTATGLRYQGSMAAGRNFVLNGGMEIWQRSTSQVDGNNSYITADRWLCSQAPQVTFSRQLTNDTTNLPFVQYCMRLQRTSGSTQTNAMNIAQSFETVNSIPLAGKTVTLSFYARKGANYSNSSSAVVAQLVTGTGTDQNVYTQGYTGSVTAINQSAVLTTTWQRFSYSATLATNATEIGLLFIGGVTGTAGAADFYEITGIQLEVGSVATQFTRQGGSIQGETSACQRYYYRFNGSAVSNYIATGFAFSSTVAYAAVPHPTTMRTTPSFGSAAASNFGVLGAGGSSGSAVSGSNLNVDTFVFNYTQSSGLTANSGLLLYGSTNAYYELSAEL